jgi:hypothetical protein
MFHADWLGRSNRCCFSHGCCRWFVKLISALDTKVVDNVLRNNNRIGDHQLLWFQEIISSLHDRCQSHTFDNNIRKNISPWVSVHITWTLEATHTTLQPSIKHPWQQMHHHLSSFTCWIFFTRTIHTLIEWWWYPVATYAA